VGGVSNPARPETVEENTREFWIQDVWIRGV
jgi:hypothetical protein